MTQAGEAVAGVVEQQRGELVDVLQPPDAVGPGLCARQRARRELDSYQCRRQCSSTSGSPDAWASARCSTGSPAPRSGRQPSGSSVAAARWRSSRPTSTSMSREKRTPGSPCRERASSGPFSGTFAIPAVSSAAATRSVVSSISPPACRAASVCSATAPAKAAGALVPASSRTRPPSSGTSRCNLELGEQRTPGDLSQQLASTVPRSRAAGPPCPPPAGRALRGASNGRVTAPRAGRRRTRASAAEDARGARSRHGPRTSAWAGRRARAVRRRRAARAWRARPAIA